MLLPHACITFSFFFLSCWWPIRQRRTEGWNEMKRCKGFLTLLVTLVGKTEWVQYELGQDREVSRTRWMKYASYTIGIYNRSNSNWYCSVKVCCRPSRRHLHCTILVLSTYSAFLGGGLMSRKLGFSINVLFLSYFVPKGLCKSDFWGVLCRNIFINTFMYLHCMEKMTYTPRLQKDKDEKYWMKWFTGNRHWWMLFCCCCCFEHSP